MPFFDGFSKKVPLGFKMVSKGFTWLFSEVVVRGCFKVVVPAVSTGTPHSGLPAKDNARIVKNVTIRQLST